MILEKGECVICDTPDECVELARMLETHGYGMFDPMFGTPLEAVHLRNCDKRGMRYRIGGNYTFPMCLATISNEQAQTILASGTLHDSDGYHEHVWYTFREWAYKIAPAPPCIDDLI